MRSELEICVFTIVITRVMILAPAQIAEKIKSAKANIDSYVTYCKIPPPFFRELTVRRFLALTSIIIFKKMTYVKL